MKGVSLPVPMPLTTSEYFAVDPRVVAQLISSEGICWTSEFTTATKNDGVQFKAKAP